MILKNILFKPPNAEIDASLPDEITINERDHQPQFGGKRIPEIMKSLQNAVECEEVLISNTDVTRLLKFAKSYTI